LLRTLVLSTGMSGLLLKIDTPVLKITPHTRHKMPAQPNQFVVINRVLHTGHINRNGVMVDIRPVRYHHNGIIHDGYTVCPVYVQTQVQIENPNFGLINHYSDRHFSVCMDYEINEHGYVTILKNKFFDFTPKHSIIKYTKEYQENRDKEHKERAKKQEELQEFRVQILQKMYKGLDDLTLEAVKEYPKHSRRFGSKAIDNSRIRERILAKFPELIFPIDDKDYNHTWAERAVNKYLEDIRLNINRYWLLYAQQNKRKTNNVT